MMKKGLSILIGCIMLLNIFFPVGLKAQSQNNLQEEIIYDILVDRFNNGNQKLSEQVDLDDPLTYHGGDIVGVTKKLDEIQAHGFTTISLSPIMENAPKGYHGYWIEDLYNIEEQFGTKEDLNELLEEAHNRDMKVILELVTNYVANSHPFLSDATKQEWFRDNEVEPIASTEWLKNTAAFDQTNEDVQEYLLDVASYWMDEFAIDGFKLHAADQMADDFIKILTKEIKSNNPSFYIIASTLQGDNHLENLINNEYIDAVENSELYRAMNESLIEPDQPISALYDTWKETGNKKSLLFVDNKNTARFSNNFAENERNAVTTWTLALAYLYFMPGTPVIYQGSEVPMYCPGFPENQYIVDFTSADPDLEDVFDKMAAIRKEFPALSYGYVEQVAVENGFSLFKRSYEDKDIYIAINNDSESHAVKISGIDSSQQLRGLIHDDTIRENKEGEFLIGMERESAEVFIVQPNVGFNWGFISFVVGVFAVFIFAIIWLSRKQKQRGE